MTSVKRLLPLIIAIFAGCAVAGPRMGISNAPQAPLKVQIIDPNWNVLSNFVTTLTMGGDVTGPSSASVLGAIQGYPVSNSTPASNGLLMGSSGGKWAPVASPSPGPTPAPSPTAIAGLPACDGTHVSNLGLFGSVSNQNCAGVTFHATPLPTAGQGCQTQVYCYGAPTGTPTPSWVIY